MALVARSSGQSDANGSVISGNPTLYPNFDFMWNTDILDWGNLELNKGNGAGGSLADSVDAYGSGDTETGTRHGDVITSQVLSARPGETLDDIWADLSTYANELGAAQFRYDPAQIAPPVGIGLNSNSIVATLLSSLGLDVNSLPTSHPLLKWPGSNTLLATGARNTELFGFGENDTFLVRGGGAHILHGDDGTALVPSDPLDGQIDSVVWSGVDAVHVNLSSDRTSWVATKVIGENQTVDTLYSIEGGGVVELFRASSVNLANATGGAIFEDATPEQQEDAEKQFAFSIDSLVNISVATDDLEWQASNFGTFVGSDYDDSFLLKQLVGRSFYGEDGSDTVDYSAMETALTITLASDDPTSHWTVIRTGDNPATDPIDELHSIEKIVGGSGTDTFVGAADGDLGESFTIDGGAGKDLYTYRLSNLSTNAALDVGWVTITDTDEGIINIADEAFHNVTVGLGEFDSSFVQLVAATTTGGLNIILDRVSLENGTGITNIILDGFNFDASDLVGWLFDQLPDNFLYDITDIDHEIGAGRVGTASNDTFPAYSSGDVLVGGQGDDVYQVSAYVPVIVEEPGEGTDTVEASASYSLPDNVENLLLTGSSNINATGNALVNILTGNTGANTLDGGAGADTMAGGAGNDIYMVDDGGDVVLEASSSGTDEVRATVTYTINLYTEHLTLLGTANINGFGNAATNSLVGNSGDNTLDGGGSTDHLFGGAGDDTYIVDTLDSITENLNEGTDTVVVVGSVGHTLSANVENLTLTGTANLNGVGNALDNIIIGNDGNNSLNGDAGSDTISGGAGNDSIAGGSGADTMSGGTGNDTYSVDDVGDLITENPGEGTDWVSSSVNYTISANVEHLVLTGTAAVGTGNSGSNTIAGNSSVNTLFGLEGDDVLDGGAGADTLVGGAGDDFYRVDNPGDVVTEVSAEGTDLVEASISYTLTSEVENLTLSGALNIHGTGNTSANTITGNTGANSLSGGDGNDVLNGNDGVDTLVGGNGNDSLDGGSGADTLDGGANDDAYIIDNTSDVILTANESSGTDTVLTSVNYTLGANLENITATGVNVITITGNSGNNVLTGKGDGTLAGGAGNDTYYIFGNEVVSESASSGTDTVYAPTYTLTSNVENLVLIGTLNYNGTGNTLANTIIGNSGNNTLDGGTGNDVLIGGVGNDTYLVNTTADSVTENVGEGVDTVITSVTGYTLAANVENLVLGGSVATGTGNSDDNTITGNSAANTLNGGDGADVLDGLTGNDVMNGGLGDDVFYVDSSSDNANENASAGTDTVYASVTYAMNTGSRVNVENLILTGTSNINGTGNSLVNTITGNSGNNTLDGGAGADSLIGGAGDDTYIVDDVADAISDSGGTDTVQSSISWTLDADLENLTLSGSSGIHGTGNSGNNTITGNTGANSLSGADGADVLNGGAAVDTLNGGNGDDTLDGGAGNDTMDGGDGDDVYVVDSASDTIIDSSGTDTVQSSVTYTLAAGLENLTLTGTTISGTGNNASNYLIGSASVNTLTGLDGNDTIDGGAGADTMIGGTGDDLYYISVTTDKVTEFASEGTDTVIATVTGYTLAANVENLILNGSVANGSGNGENNVITGNSANNSVSGLLGDDTYMLGSGGNDIINETINGGGTDTLWITGGTTISDVTASTSGLNDIIAYGSGQVTLTNVNSANSQYYIETIRFDDGFFTTLMDNNTWTSGTSGADTLTGNSSHNVMIGKDGADTLDGAGGDDDIHGGSGNDVVKGGAGADLLHGGTGNDILYGEDGLDTMFGGTGLDTFVFEAATAYNNIDVIHDFNVLTDDDVLDLRDLLSGYNPGSHVLTDFVKIEDSGSDSIVSIDRDGTGSAYGWNQVATLKGITGLTDEAALVSGGNLLAA